MLSPLLPGCPPCSIGTRSADPTADVLAGAGGNLRSEQGSPCRGNALCRELTPFWLTLKVLYSLCWSELADREREEIQKRQQTYSLIDIFHRRSELSAAGGTQVRHRERLSDGRL
jgi:hypothetical protein